MESILFDFGGTLDADGTTWLERFHAIYKEEGIEPPRERFDRAFYDADDGLPARAGLPGLDLEKTLSLQVSAVLETLAPEKLSLKGKVVDRFLKDCRRHFKRNRPLLERLRRKYRLGIVSNFYGNLDSVLRGEGLRDLFDVVADSGVVGAQKPEPAIFLHALSVLGSDSARSVMVGDSIPRDMRGAEGLRMPHALLTGTPRPPCCPAGWTLATLADLEARLS